MIVGTAGTIPPYNFYVGDKLSGMDIELIKRFAYEYNYKLEFRIEELPSQLLDVEFGKSDMLSGTITYTEERAEHVHFEKPPVLVVPSAIIVRNESSAGENFIKSLQTSFEKTLIREDRYKMIFDGLKVTLNVYKRQVISLIKATSIVGCIAVQDLTKVSDIIRARTYEAFFSLIFTAAIYFLIAQICIFLLNVAENKLNRRKRNVE